MGSEMCIRDRYPAAARNRPLVLNLTHHTAFACNHVCRWAPAHAYSSTTPPPGCSPPTASRLSNPSAPDVCTERTTVIRGDAAFVVAGTELLVELIMTVRFFWRVKLPEAVVPESPSS